MLSVCLCAGLADNEDKSDVQAIIESTPELDMDLSGYKGARYHTHTHTHTHSHHRVQARKSQI